MSIEDVACDEEWTGVSRECRACGIANACSCTPSSPAHASTRAIRANHQTHTATRRLTLSFIPLISLSSVSLIMSAAAVANTSTTRLHAHVCTLALATSLHTPPVISLKHRNHASLLVLMANLPLVPLMSLILPALSLIPMPMRMPQLGQSRQQRNCTHAQ